MLTACPVTNSTSLALSLLQALRCLVLLLQSLGAWHDAATARSAAAAGSGPQGGAQAAAPELPEEVIKSSWMETLPAGDRDAALGNADSEQKQAQMLESWKAYKRTFQEGVALFNKKPKSGIAFLQARRHARLARAAPHSSAAALNLPCLPPQEQGLVGRDPNAVSQFLVKSEGLNKVLVGDYLGEREDFNLKVMHSYVDGMNFTELAFDEAIRHVRQLACTAPSGCSAPCPTRAPAVD